MVDYNKKFAFNSEMLSQSQSLVQVKFFSSRTPNMSGLILVNTTVATLGNVVHHQIHAIKAPAELIAFSSLKKQMKKCVWERIYPPSEEATKQLIGGSRYSENPGVWELMGVNGCKILYQIRVCVQGPFHSGPGWLCLSSRSEWTVSGTRELNLTTEQHVHSSAFKVNSSLKLQYNFLMYLKPRSIIIIPLPVHLRYYWCS